jgi:hypothetical protein
VAGRWIPLPEFCGLSLGLVEFAADTPTVQIRGQSLTYTETAGGQILVPGFMAQPLEVQVQDTRLTVAAAGYICTLRRPDDVETPTIAGEWRFNGSCLLDGARFGSRAGESLIFDEYGDLTFRPMMAPYGLVGPNRVLTRREGALWEVTMSVSPNVLVLESARFLDGPRAGREQTFTGNCTLHRAAG